MVSSDGDVSGFVSDDVPQDPEKDDSPLKAASPAAQNYAAQPIPVLSTSRSKLAADQAVVKSGGWSEDEEITGDHDNGRTLSCWTHWTQK